MIRACVRAPGPGSCPSPACPCYARGLHGCCLDSPLPAPSLSQVPSPPWQCQHWLARIPQTSSCQQVVHRPLLVCDVRKVGGRCPRPLLATDGSACGQAGTTCPVNYGWTQGVALVHAGRPRAIMPNKPANQSITSGLRRPLPKCQSRTTVLAQGCLDP